MHDCNRIRLYHFFIYVLFCTIFTFLVCRSFNRVRRVNAVFFQVKNHCGERKSVMKVVVFKSPKLLAGILRLIFKIKKEEA